MKIKKIIKFYDRFYNKFSQKKKNNREEEKYHKNNNLILKKKNFEDTRFKRINFINSQKNLTLFYFLNDKVKSSNLLKSFSINLKQIGIFNQFKSEKLTQTNILNQRRGEIFQIFKHFDYF